ncbi:MAG TPA: NUDIX domain-containing protein [Anaeromyxobacteraceae bacterium]|nr:NUDIX domain-containing protein [Anaeromyxobacteraceae bacterium]
MIVRVDVLPLLLEARRVLVAEVVGGFFGQAALGRFWLPCGPLQEGEQPAEAARRLVRAQLGLDLEGVLVVGTRQHPVGGAPHLALVMAGAVSGEPEPGPPVSGFAARLLGELPDQVGFYHRDEIALLASRYERLRD